MRVLHTVDSLHPDTGGPARSVPGLAGAASKAGAEIHLWAAHVPDDYSPPHNVTLHSGDLPSKNFDLVHDHGLWLPTNHRVAKWSSAGKIPRLVSPRGMLEPWALNHNKWKKKIAWALYQKRNLRSAIAFHATAESEAAQIENLGFNQASFVVPNGIRFDEFDGAFTKTKTILFLSRIHPKKGLPMWIEAWKKVSPDGWTMRVVGPDEGSHTDELKRQVDQAGLSDQWQFEGPLEGNDKYHALGSASLFVLPTYSENFGIVVAESLAAGTPVITTTGTPWQGLVEHDCGWWVKPTPDDLAKALAEAITCDERNQMGAKGARWVKNEFAWDDIGKKIVNAYQEILNGH